MALGLALSAHAQAKPEAACITRIFDGAAFTVCAYSPVHQQLNLAWKDSAGRAYRGFPALKASLGPAATGVRFAFNAGMYDDTGAPVGLYVAKGKTLHPLNRADGPGNFHMKPNGVLWLDKAGGAHVTSTDVYASTKPKAQWATQSGPMLVIAGKLHPDIAADGPSRYIRNGVGACSGGKTLFVISDEAVSFGKLARLFRDELKCPDALFLDGSVSSLWRPEVGRMDDFRKLGPLVVVSGSNAPPRTPTGSGAPRR